MRMRMFLLSAFIAGGFAFSTIDAMTAPLFRCREASGATVFTDSPAQLPQCTPVTLDTLPALSIPAAPPPPPAESLPLPPAPPPGPTADEAVAPPAPPEGPASTEFPGGSDVGPAPIP